MHLLRHSPREAARSILQSNGKRKQDSMCMVDLYTTRTSLVKDSLLPVELRVTSVSPLRELPFEASG